MNGQGNHEREPRTLYKTLCFTPLGDDQVQMFNYGNFREIRLYKKSFIVGDQYEIHVS